MKRISIVKNKNISSTVFSDPVAFDNSTTRQLLELSQFFSKNLFKEITLCLHWTRIHLSFHFLGFHYFSINQIKNKIEQATSLKKIKNFQFESIEAAKAFSVDIFIN